MEEMLGIPVVPISAAKNEGIEELIDHAVHVAKYREAPGRQDFCDVNDHNGAVHRCLYGIMSLIEDHAHDAGIPVRFAASKLAEGDQLVLDRLNLDQNEKETLEHIITQMEKERGLDRARRHCRHALQLHSKSVWRCGRKAEGKPRARKKRGDRPHFDRQIHGNTGVYRHYGSCILADV